MKKSKLILLAVSLRTKKIINCVVRNWSCIHRTLFLPWEMQFSPKVINLYRLPVSISTMTENLRKRWAVPLGFLLRTEAG